MTDPVRIVGAPTDYGANAAGVDSEAVALVGIREREAIRGHGLATFSISEIDRRGVTNVVADALDTARGFTSASISIGSIRPRRRASGRPSGAVSPTARRTRRSNGWPTRRRCGRSNPSG